jgi:hypothetical protein
MFVCSLGRKLHLPDSAAEARRMLLWSKGRLPVRKLRMSWFVWLHEGEVSQLNELHYTAGIGSRERPHRQRCIVGGGNARHT